MALDFDYSALASMAHDLVAASGRAMTLCKSGTTPQVSGEPWRGVNDAFSSSSPGTSINVQGTEIRHFEADEGTEIKRGDREILIAAQGIADIDFFDGIKDGGKTWRIVSNRILRPGSTTLLYTLRVRQ